MYNKEVIRLWLTAQKIRGQVEKKDLYNAIFITLFFKHLELNKNAISEKTPISYDERFSIQYLSLTYGKVVALKDVIAYLEVVESEIGITNKIISHEVNKIYEWLGEESVRDIFNAVNEISINTSKELCEIVNQLLYKMASESEKNLAEVVTNYYLSVLEGKLLDCHDNMLVYDGFCGSGMSVNEVANNKGKIYIQDIDPGILAVATIITLIKGNKIGEIGCGDSFLNKMNSEKYDRVVCEPVIKFKYDKEYIKMALDTGNILYKDILDGETLALRHSLSLLKEDGVAAVLVPAGILFKGGKVGKVREKLIRDKYIETIIEFPIGILAGTYISSALLILRRKKNDERIFMINANDICGKLEKSQIVLSEESIEKILDVYKNRKRVEGVSNYVTIDELLNNECNLCTTKYVTKKPENKITLGDIALYSEKYERLKRDLLDVDEKLTELRKRWLE